jgi:hypothetical protein
MLATAILLFVFLLGLWLNRRRPASTRHPGPSLGKSVRNSLPAAAGARRFWIK